MVLLGGKRLSPRYGSISLGADRTRCATGGYYIVLLSNGPRASTTPLGSRTARAAQAMLPRATFCQPLRFSACTAWSEEAHLGSKLAAKG